MNEPVIRRAEERDAAAILAYLNLVGGESDNLLFGKDAFAGCPVEQEEVHTRAANEGKNAMLLAFDGAQIVSVALLTVGRRDRIAHHGTLALSVRKDHWGRGIGGAMLTALIRTARENGLEALDLGVRADNARAIALYERFGFRVYGRYARYICIDGVYYDDLFMNLYL